MRLDYGRTRNGCPSARDVTYAQAGGMSPDESRRAFGSVWSRHKSCAYGFDRIGDLIGPGSDTGVFPATLDGAAKQQWEDAKAGQ